MVVLLITVSLAAAAWTYISSYWGGLVGSAIEVTSINCQNGVNATIYIHNIGTQRLSMDDLDVTRTDGGGTASYVYYTPDDGYVTTGAVLKPGQTGRIIDTACTTTGQQRCSYDILDRAGHLHQHYTTCPG